MSSLDIAFVVPFSPNIKTNLGGRTTTHRAEIFQSVSADNFHVVGRAYVYVDRKFWWPYVSSCPRPTSAAHLVSALRSVFADTGLPVVLDHSSRCPRYATSWLGGGWNTA